MQRINEFLSNAKVFFLATTDGDQPKIRPLGFQKLVDGKLIFGIGNHKDVYRQLIANPRAEITAMNEKMEWIRYTGKAVFETDNKYEELVFVDFPYLRDVYKQIDAHIAIFHLEDAKAEIRSASGEVIETLSC